MEEGIITTNTREYEANTHSHTRKYIAPFFHSVEEAKKYLSSSYIRELSGHKKKV